LKAIETDTMQRPPVSKLTFDKYDKDKSGKISRWEFGEMVLALGYKLSAEELELAVKKLDQHGGGIGYADFAKWWASDNRFQHLQLR
jgi:Ca2+-binding EF-hand superfamily protein